MMPSKDTTVSLLTLCLLCTLGYAESHWVNPEIGVDSLRLELEDHFEWYKLEPKSLMVTYKTAHIKGNLVLSLFGYSERNATKISKVKTPFTLLASAPVPENPNNESATFTFDVMTVGLKCKAKDDAECNRYDMGYLQISKEKTFNYTYPRSLISQIVPLGWFVHPLYLKENFKDWPYGKCEAWFKSESLDLQNLMKNLSCPATMGAAKNDPGWYLRASYLVGFPISSRKTGNFSAEPSQTCFYSAIETPAPSSPLAGKNGSTPWELMAAPASICCYKNSDSTLLHKEFVTPEKPPLHGSSVLRSHPYGSDNHHEHYRPGQVPYLSHWYWDKLPYLHCCQWWKGTTFVNYYMKLRPVPRIAKKPEDTLTAYVTDSHIHPIGGGAPIFCPSMGEYWLVRSATIQIQMRNYVVSRFEGDLPAENPPRYLFLLGGSRSTFVTGVAMRSAEDGMKVMELVCPEGEFRCYPQATDKQSQSTTPYEGNAGRGLGTRLLVGDAVPGVNKQFSFLVRHGNSRVGMIGYAAEPSEEFVNLYFTLSGDLKSQMTGLLVGGTCEENKLTSDDAASRLFSSACDNCDDFLKYSYGRPLYYETLADSDIAKIPGTPGINCNNDKECNYIAWSTRFGPNCKAVEKAIKEGIEPAIKELQHKDVDNCQNPNVLGLYIGPDQSFLEGAVLQLTCMEPRKPSTDGVAATCKKSATGDLEFDVPSGFSCTDETPKAKEEAVVEKAAQEATVQYTKKHYTPEESASSDEKADGSRLVSSAGIIGAAVLCSIGPVLAALTN